MKADIPQDVMRNAGWALRGPMNVTPGVRLCPYEILSALGAGGMDEKVYRAKDTKLHREV